MKHSKKILALLLALMTLTTVLPAQAAGNTNQLIHQRFWSNKDFGMGQINVKFTKYISICYSNNSTVLASGTIAYTSNNKVQMKLKPTQDVIASVVGRVAAGSQGLIYGTKVGPRALLGSVSTAEVNHDIKYTQYWFGIQFWGTCHGNSSAPSYSAVYPHFT